MPGDSPRTGPKRAWPCWDTPRKRAQERRRRDMSGDCPQTRPEGSVAVEAFARLATELARFDHRLEPGRWSHARLWHLRVQDLARVHVHVDADEVEQRTRAEGPARAEREAAVEILRRHPRLVEHAHAVVEERD